MAVDEPNKAIASIPIGSEIEDGFRDISARMMADAVNRAAWFLEVELGRCDDFQTICYLGPSDLRYPILLSAAAKVGYKTFWTSPRNSLAGHLALLEAVECKIFLTPNVIPPGMGEIIGQLQMRHLVVPEQDSWINPTQDVALYRYEKTYDQARMDPLTVIHTSGSTGTISSSRSCLPRY
jgi:acyl-coenzyme A synthetase/AMP-(fatty) acid ligase